MMSGVTGKHKHSILGAILGFIIGFYIVFSFLETTFLFLVNELGMGGYLFLGLFCALTAVVIFISFKINKGLGFGVLFGVIGVVVKVILFYLHILN